MAPSAFNLENSTTFVEPGAPLTALVVFERELFMAPDERGTSLRGRFGSGEEGHMNTKIIRELASFEASSADPTRG